MSIDARIAGVQSTKQSTGIIIRFLGKSSLLLPLFYFFSKPFSPRFKSFSGLCRYEDHFCFWIQLMDPLFYSLEKCTEKGRGGCEEEKICSFCDRHTNICQLIFDKKKADI